MKTVRKTLILAACAILLVCATVVGTLAYLTAKTSVTNTFTVGNVSITMDETDVDNSTPGADRDTKNSYKLLPGKEYVKDPTITVKAMSEDCYVFVKVTNGIGEIEKTDEPDGYKTISTQMSNNGWIPVAEGSDVYYYNGDGAKEGVIKYSESDTKLAPVFTKFAVKSETNAKDLAKFTGKTIEVTAYAIQAEGFTSASDAWTKAGNEAEA